MAHLWRKNCVTDADALERLWTAGAQIIGRTFEVNRTVVLRSGDHDAVMRDCTLLAALPRNATVITDRLPLGQSHGLGHGRIENCQIIYRSPNA
jgi:hypothetical protein